MNTELYGIFYKIKLGMEVNEKTKPKVNIEIINIWKTIKHKINHKALCIGSRNYAFYKAARGALLLLLCWLAKAQKIMRKNIFFISLCMHHCISEFPKT